MQLMRLKALSVFEVVPFVARVKALLNLDVNLTFDFTEVEQLDTAGVQALIACVKEIGNRGGTVNILESLTLNDVLCRIGLTNLTAKTMQVTQ